MSATRDVLPARRPAEVFNLRHGGIDYAVTLGRYADGRLGEVFLSCVKAGSTVAHLARDAAVLISLALQFGAPIATLAGAVTRSQDGSAAGLAGAVLDAILAQEAAAA